jgi:hypothetical protein
MTALLDLVRQDFGTTCFAGKDLYFQVLDLESPLPALRFWLPGKRLGSLTIFGSGQ